MPAVIKIDYSQFKHSGVYTLEFDASESIIIGTQTTRMIIGFSRKGPFNFPMYFTNPKNFKNVFGEIDPFLERRGCFFHRSCYTALRVGPIYALNLMALNNVDDIGDYVNYTSYSLSVTEPNGEVARWKYIAFFNQERFWQPTEEALQAVVNYPGSINEGKLFNVVNIGQTPVSVLIRKAPKAEVAKFDITAKEWYGVGNVPTYIDDYDFISDYFIQLYIVKGKWDDYRKLSTDPTYSQFFDIRGLKKSQFSQFMGDPTVQVLGSFIGTVLPDFVDGNGISWSVDTQVNNIWMITGVYMSLDKTALENYDPKAANLDDLDTVSAIDMVGHNFANPDRGNPEIIDFLSYRTTIKDGIRYPLDTTFNFYKQPEGGLILNIGQPITTSSEKKGRDYGYLNNVLIIPKPFPEATMFTEDEWLELYASIIPGSSIIRLEGTEEKWGLIQSKEVRNEIDSTTGGYNDFLYLKYTHPNKAKETLFKGLPFTIAAPSAQNMVDFPDGILERIPVRLASTGSNIPLSGFAATLDGVTILNGDRILLKDQTDKRQNGVYVANTTLNTLVRSSDLNQTNELAFSSFFFVTDGVLNFGKGFALKTKNATIDVDNLDFVEYTKPALNFIKSLMPRAYTQVTNDLYADPTWWPITGDDILLEHKAKRLYYYVKLAEDVIYLDSGNRVVVNLTFDSIPALLKINTSPYGYVATTHCEEKAKLDMPEVVFEPDKFYWDSPEGLYGGIDLFDVSNTSGLMSISISAPVGTPAEDYVGDNLTFGEFNNPTIYTKTTFTAGSYGALRIENQLSGEVRFLQIRKNVSVGDYQTIGSNIILTLHIIDTTLLDDITSPSDWKLSWNMPEAAHFKAYKFSKLYEYFTANVLLPGDKYYYSTDNYFNVFYEQSTDKDGIPILKVYGFDTFNEKTLNFDNLSSRGINSGYFMNPNSNYVRGQLLPYDTSDPEEGGVWLYGVADKLYDPIEILSYSSDRKTFSISKANGSLIQIGQYIVSEVRDTDNIPTYRLTRVIGKRFTSEGVYEFDTNLAVKIDINGTLRYVTRYVPLEDFIPNYQLNYLSGFKMNDFHLPGGLHKFEQMEKILNMLDESNTALREMLAEKDIITFRYIVDTFDGAIAPNTGPKSQLSRTAMRRQKCLALLNAPGIDEFKNSNNPLFTDPPTREQPLPPINARYISEGGNLDLGPTNKFTLVDEQNGSKFAGYFMPYLLLRERGKLLKIPPAAHVSNNFVLKFINGTPYKIVAGTRRGILSDPNLFGVEYELVSSQRDYLEPMGINPIIKKNGFGYVIYGNNMAYQTTHSAFNNLHVRDLLITLEESIETVLENYVFEFNDEQTRSEVKDLADNFLASVRLAGGVRNYQTIMDETNNTNEIISQNLGIIDVYIEPAYGIHKFINRVTLFKPGGISSGGFMTFI